MLLPCIRALEWRRGTFLLNNGWLRTRPGQMRLPCIRALETKTKNASHPATSNLNIKLSHFHPETAIDGKQLPRVSTIQRILISTEQIHPKNVQHLREPEPGDSNASLSHSLAAQRPFCAPQRPASPSPLPTPPRFCPFPPCFCPGSHPVLPRFYPGFYPLFPRFLPGFSIHQISNPRRHLKLRFRPPTFFPPPSSHHPKPLFATTNNTPQTTNMPTPKTKPTKPTPARKKPLQRFKNAGFSPQTALFFDETKPPRPPALTLHR
jgi:hypothetical protein